MCKWRTNKMQLILAFGSAAPSLLKYTLNFLKKKRRVVQSKQIIKGFIIVSLGLFFLRAEAQERDCIQVVKNIDKRNFAAGDTVEISLENLGNDTVSYNLQVLVYDGKTWNYSPHYTRYFNYYISYGKLRKLFTSKISVSFSQDDSWEGRTLLPREVSRIWFGVDKKVDDKSLIKFEFDVVEKISAEESYDCKFVYSSPFYFFKIKKYQSE